MKLVYTFLILLCLTSNLHAQLVDIGDDELAEQIRQSDKNYKLIHIFCNYCEVSQIRYPEVALQIFMSALLLYSK